MQVLIVEDNAAVALGLSRSLETLDPEICIHAVPDLKSAELLLATDQPIDVALVDLGLPDAKGIEAPTTLKAMREDLVIVVITGNSSSETALRLIRQGIQDYILKSEASPHSILRSVRLACERHQREQKLKRMTRIDQLTGALNRRGLLAAIEESYESATRLGISAALMTLDLDHFKAINDTHGHPVGDEILREASRRIGHCIRKNDIFGRIGGDEFWVILNGFTGPEDVPAVARKMLECFAAPYHPLEGISTDSFTISMGFSIGIAVIPEQADSVQSWMRKSDAALYHAKRKGRNRWMMYDSSIDAEVDGEPGTANRTGPSMKLRSAH
jgi:diguanylate cyclase (GGDEF)-like protein